MFSSRWGWAVPHVHRTSIVHLLSGRLTKDKILIRKICLQANRVVFTQKLLDALALPWMAGFEKGRTNEIPLHRGPS